MGRWDQAIATAEKGRKADPFGLLANFGPGSVYVFQHRWDDAIHAFQGAIGIDPNYWFDYCFLGRAYEAKGRFAEATGALQRGLALEDSTELWSALGHVYEVSGQPQEARKVLDRLTEMSGHRYVAPYNVAVIYAGLGEADETFAWLERAFNDRSYLLAVYMTTDTRLDPLRGDPRFDELRHRVGLPKIN